MKFISIWILSLATLASNANGQYEQFVNDPESLQKRMEEANRPASEPAKPPKLAAPDFHKLPILGMDQSVDQAYLLTYDQNTIKIWDVAQRVAIISHTYSTRGTHPSKPLHILGAYFTSKSNQVCIVTTQSVTIYDEFNFGFRDKMHNFSQFEISGQHYDRRRNIVYTSSFYRDTFDKEHTLTIRSLNLDTFQSKNVISTEIPPEELNYPNGQFDLDKLHSLSINSKGNLALLNLGNQEDTFLINLESAQVEKRIPLQYRVKGFTATGQLLAITETDSEFTISDLNPVTYSQTKLFTYPKKSKYTQLSFTLPTRLQDPLVLSAENGFMAYDFTTKVATAPIKLRDETTCAVNIVRKGLSQLLIAQATKAKNSSREYKAIHLDSFDLQQGVLKTSWALPTFLPQRIYTRADGFEMLVERDSEIRKIRFTDSGIESQLLKAPKESSPISAFYSDSGSWGFLYPTQPALARPTTDPASGEYTMTSFGENNYRDPKADVFRVLDKVYFTDHTPNEQIFAQHHRSAITVYDASKRKRTALFPLDTNVAYIDDQIQLIALSPNGKYLAYSYYSQKDHIPLWHLVCRDLATQEILWQHERPAEGKSIDLLKFSEDSNYLYVNGYKIFGARITVLYASTGETYKGLSTKYAVEAQGRDICYNQAGTLVALTSGNRISLQTLPEGVELANFGLDTALSEIQFIGSDQFLIGKTGINESLSLIDLKKQACVAEIYLFDSLDKWLVRNPETGVFASDQNIQNQLYFVQEKQVSPLSAYFDDFYRPRLLGSVIKGLSLKPSIDLADLKRAPKITLKLEGSSQRGLTVEDEFQSFEVPSDSVTLLVEASSVGSAVEDIRLYHNGKLISGATRGLLVEDDEDLPSDETYKKNLSETYTLTPGKNRFRAVAINDQGTESIPDEVIIYSSGMPEEATGGIRLHLLVIGINQYKNPQYNLNYARADAEALEQALAKSYERVFSQTEVYRLYDSGATRENILATLELIKQEAGPRDVFILYYAGHGLMSDDASPQFYIAPYEVTQLFGNQDSLSQAAISSDKLLAYSRDIAAQKQLFILDACQSAGVLKTVAQRGAAEEKAIAQLARSTGTHWLTATGSEQFATEFAELGHGAFTYTLLAALKGAADSGDGIVSVNELKAYIEAKVPEVTERYKGEAQYPASYGYGQDFPVSLSNP